MSYGRKQFFFNFPAVISSNTKIKISLQSIHHWLPCNTIVHSLIHSRNYPAILFANIVSFNLIKYQLSRYNDREHYGCTNVNDLQLPMQHNLTVPTPWTYPLQSCIPTHWSQQLALGTVFWPTYNCWHASSVSLMGVLWSGICRYKMSTDCFWRHWRERFVWSVRLSRLKPTIINTLKLIKLNTTLLNILLGGIGLALVAIVNYKNSTYYLTTITM